jgi:ABC-type transport system substrate-binding protein
LRSIWLQAFPLRQGVKWHDGKPFTAADIKCTFDLFMDNATEKPGLKKPAVASC